MGANFCIHKYFFERSQAWQDVVAEEEEAMQQTHHDEDEEEHSTSTSRHFDPIDSRHLSSLQLVQARIEKLLRISPHQTHSLKNLIIKIVCSCCEYCRLTDYSISAGLYASVENGS